MQPCALAMTGSTATDRIAVNKNIRILSLLTPLVKPMSLSLQRCRTKSNKLRGPPEAANRPSLCHSSEPDLYSYLSPGSCAKNTAATQKLQLGELAAPRFRRAGCFCCTAISRALRFGLLAKPWSTNHSNNSHQVRASHGLAEPNSIRVGQSASRLLCPLRKLTSQAAS